MTDYMQDMQSGTDAQEALNGLVSQLFFQTQGNWIQEHMDADMDEALKRFSDALMNYRKNETALSVELEKAGFAAPEDMSALSYAADQLMGREERTGETPEVKYNLKQNTPYNYAKPFADQVEDYDQGLIPEKNALLIGRTPELYTQMGLSDLPMMMDQEHVDAALYGTKDADHVLGKEGLKQLPDLLKHPVAVIESTSQGREDRSVVAFFNATINGKQTLIPIEINRSMRLNDNAYDANKISSVYGKNNALSMLTDAIQKQLQGETSVFYINKTEARGLYARAGVQFPGSALQDGLNSSIHDAGSPVNKEYLGQTDTRQFRRWFKGSQIVNEDGTPKIVYHGTSGRFTVFDMDKARTNMDIQGAFFSPNAEESGEYGDNVGAFYLSIKKPAPASVAFAALQKYKGQNDAGAKARQDLIEQNYDGVDFDGEEYIAFYPEQIKSATENEGTFDKNNPDYRYNMKRENVAGDVEDDAALYAQVESDRDAREALEILQRLDESAREEAKGAWEKRLAEIGNKIIGETGSKISKQKLNGMLRNLYEAMEDGDFSRIARIGIFGPSL